LAVAAGRGKRRHVIVRSPVVNAAETLAERSFGEVADLRLHSHQHDEQTSRLAERGPSRFFGADVALAKLLRRSPASERGSWQSRRVKHRQSRTREMLGGGTGASITWG
jgi:hypothetical protein